MKRPPLDTPITLVVNGDLIHAKVSGPSWVRGSPDEDTSFPVLYAHGGAPFREWLFAGDEGVTWLRGHLDGESPEAKALLTAEALR